MAAALPTSQSEDHRYIHLSDVDWTRAPASSLLESPSKELGRDEDVGALLSFDGVAFDFKVFEEVFSKILVSEKRDVLPQSLQGDYYAEQVVLQKPKALWLDVPENFVSQKVLRLSDFLDASRGVFVKNLHLNLGKNSELKVYNDFTSTDSSEQMQSFLALLNYTLEENSHLHVFQMQDLSERAVFSIRQSMSLSRDATLSLWTYHTGAAKGQHRVESVCAGENAKAKVKFGVRASRDQKIDIWTSVSHPVKHTESDTTAWNVLSDNAVAVFNGNIQIGTGGEKTLAYQKNNNLLLSDKAQVHSLPKLEIATDDVKCSHGATIASLDPQQLFYLQSRGIAKDQAEQMLIEGFTRPVLQEISVQKIREFFLGRQEQGGDDA